MKVNDVWYLCDDDKVRPVSTSIVLSQNAYMLFYKKRLVSPSKGSVKKGKKATSKSEETFQISETSNVTMAQETPNYKVFCIQSKEGNEGVVKEFIIRMEVPLLVRFKVISPKLSPEGSTLEVQENGTFSFRGGNIYSFERKLPFVVNPKEVKAEFFRVEGLLVLTLPVALSSSAPSSNSFRVAIQASDSSQLERFEFDPDKEVDLEKPKKIVKESNVEEASYSKLYSDIQSKAVNVPTQQAPRKEKIARNATCPCGSQLKYKKCHGK